jgi:hypothetical protein
MNMQDIRKLMCWIFAARSVQYLIISLRIILYTIHQHAALSLLRGLLTAAAFSAVVSASSGLAWWTIWKGKFSARGWAIAASLMSILIFLRQFIFPSRPVWTHHVGALFIGIVGLVAFLWRDGQMKSTARANLHANKTTYRKNSECPYCHTAIDANFVRYQGSIRCPTCELSSRSQRFIFN